MRSVLVADLRGAWELEDMIEAEREQHSNSEVVGYFKCRLCGRPDKGKYVAWATLIPMTNNPPSKELAEPLWYSLAPDEETAISILKAAVESDAGVGEWIRQPAQDEVSK